jgi:hypothetical protein
MPYLIDDVARILASPMPRREALRLVGGALAGGILGTLGLRHAAAQRKDDPDDEKCRAGTTKCGTRCCSGAQVCCQETDFRPFCATAGKTCCGSTACVSGQTCCRTSSRPFCATAGKTCCGRTACDKDDVCCNGQCCKDHEVCENGRCRASRV